MARRSAGSAAGPNHLLQGLPPAERRRLDAGTTQFAMRSGSVLCEPGRRARHVYFPHQGLIALTMPSGIEVASIGQEGMFGLPVLPGRPLSPMRAVVHDAGGAARFEAQAFLVLLERCPALGRSLLRYANGLFCQLAQEVACRSHHPLQARLARLLLAIGDRRESDAFFSTQASLARTLGVLRAAVSGTASELQRLRLIAYRRGAIRILDRHRLSSEACACYDRADPVRRAVLHPEETS